MSQLYECEGSLRPVITEFFVKFPSGTTRFIPPHKSRLLSMPWRVNGDLSRVSFVGILNIRGLLFTFSVSDSGILKGEVFNSTDHELCVAARAQIIKMYYNGPLETLFLPKEPKGLNKDISIKKVDESDPLLLEFADVFDDENVVMTRHMHALRIRFAECKFRGCFDFKGRRTPPAIDNLVPIPRIRRELESFIRKGYIERVNSSDGVFLTPIFFLPKKDGEKIRTLNDYRALNCLCDLSGATFMDVHRTLREIPESWRVFSKLDISNAFFSVGLDKDCRKLFGFNIFNETYVWKVIPQGFGWSPVWFVERMKDILYDLPVIVYADDILVGTNTLSEHDLALKQVFNRLRKFGLKLNKDKVVLRQSELDFLGYHLKNGKFDLKSYCLGKAAKLPMVSHYKHIERMLGALNYCRTHVLNLSKLIAPLHEARQQAQKQPKSCNDQWWRDLNERIQKIWKAVVDQGVELSLKTGFEEYELHVDWSGPHRGFVLHGIYDDIKAVVSVGSAKDPCPHQSSFLGELRTVRWALHSTQQFRGSVKTKVHIDNRAVVSALDTGIAAFCDDRRGARVFADICENERFLTFHYVPGSLNEGADCLSRMSVDSSSKTKINSQGVSAIRPPPQEILSRIRQAHYGHWGPETTYQNALMEFEAWPNMRKDIMEFVKRCPNCAYSGDPQIRNDPKTSFARRMGDVVHIDHSGPYFDDSHIFVVIDEATRYIAAHRVPGTGAVHAIRALDEWIRRWGLIRVIQGDNASSWNSNLFRNWAAQNRVEIRLSPSDYHKGNGLCERGIQTLLHRMRRSLNGSPNQWPEVIEGAVHAMNISWHSSIGTCPQALARGIDRSGVILDQDEHQRLWTKAWDTQQKLKDKELERFQWKHPRKSVAFQIGGRVLMKDSRHLSRDLGKLSPTWMGPYFLIRRLSDSIWECSIQLRNAPFFRAHSSQLKPYFS